MKATKVIIKGRSESGAARELEVFVDNKGKAHLWIRPLNKRAGYSIKVNAQLLVETLVKDKQN